MIIRELVASIGVDFDKRGADQAQRSIDGVGSALKGLVATFGAIGIARGFMGIVEAAANADDYLNVNRETFKEHAAGVEEWSKVTGEAMSRSEFEMRKMAGTFGSFLVPMLGGNREMAAEMSKTLGALSVDLASFYADMSDDEAMEKLKSGISGETEAVRSLGVDLSVAGLEEFARAEHMTKSVKAMTAAEKVQLRYKKILVDTKDKQGDAIRTADSYENRMRALKSSLQDLSVEAGGRFLKSFEGMLGAMRGMVEGFKNLVGSSDIAEGSLYALVTVGGMVAVAWALANIPIILAAAGIAALALVIDDLLVGMEGGQSVIKDFFVDMWGIEGWETAIKLALAYKKAITGDMDGAFDLFDQAMNPNKATSDQRAMDEANERAAREMSFDDAVKNGFIKRDPTDAMQNMVLRGDQRRALASAPHDYDLDPSDSNRTRQWSGKGLGIPSGAFDMRSDVPRMRGPLAAGLGASGMTAQPASTQTFVFHLNGPQTRESMDNVERSARKIAENARRR